MEFLQLGPTQFSKAKGHQETKKRKAPRQHIDDEEGTVELSFFEDGFILRESISWDGETDTTRVVLLHSDAASDEHVGDGSSGTGEAGEGGGKAEGACEERDVDKETLAEEERPADYQPAAVAKKVDYRATAIRIETAWRARRRLRARRMMKLGGQKKKVLRKATARKSSSHTPPVCEEASSSRDTNTDTDAGGSQTA